MKIVIRDREAERNGACGRTIAGGANDITAGMAEAKSVKQPPY